MAPISRTIAWAALAAIVSARPYNHVARQQDPEVVTETDWVTINVPVTLWVDENGTPLSTVAQGGNFAAMSTTSASSVAPVVTSAVASVPSPAATVTSTMTGVAESPKAPVETPSPATTMVATTSPAPAPVPTTTTTTQAPVQRQISSTTTAAAAVATTSAATVAAAAGGDTGAVSASSTNTCEGTGSACEGDITYYEGGLGACGWNVNTATDMQIALPYEFMGTLSNSNPYCGRSLTIKNPTTGQTIAATVGDKCMGCTGRSIDLTEVLFKAIGNGCDGRCSGFEWWFN